MKSYYNSFILVKVLVCVLALINSGYLLSQSVVTQTYTYTGAPETFTMPPCVGSLTITVRAASGGTGTSSSSPGLGGSARGVLTGTPGQILYINVGGQGSLTAGGYNG